jgi:hypothetical protein
MSQEELRCIFDVELLNDLKGKIKNQVTGNITWQERMNLYKQVQLINERIHNLALTEVS